MEQVTAGLRDGFRFFVGVDWATRKHQVCVLEASGECVGRRSFEHSGTGLLSLVGWLTELSNGALGEVAAAIEVKDGPVVETLVECGVKVHSVSPLQLDRFRDRFSPAGCKDDSRDALVMASSLMTDRALFQVVEIPHPKCIRLRDLGRLYDQLVRQEGQLYNELWWTLNRYYRQLLDLAPKGKLDAFVWDVLLACPSPAQTKRLTRQRVQKLLTKHHVRRLTSEEVLAVLRAPSLGVADGVTESCVRTVRTLLPLLKHVRSEIAGCTREMETLLAEVSDELREPCPGANDAVTVLRSHPGVGVYVAATLVGEALPLLVDRDFEGLRRLSGVAPRTVQSGNSRQVLRRRACNRRLRNACYHWGRAALAYDDSVKAHYHKLRDKGKRHARAVRGVTDRLMRILVAALEYGTLYDASRYQTARTKEAC